MTVMLVLAQAAKAAAEIQERLAAGELTPEQAAEKWAESVETFRTGAADWRRARGQQE